MHFHCTQQTLMYELVNFKHNILIFLAIFFQCCPGTHQDFISFKNSGLIGHGHRKFIFFRSVVERRRRGKGESSETVSLKCRSLMATCIVAVFCSEVFLASFSVTFDGSDPSSLVFSYVSTKVKSKHFSVYIWPH